MTETPRLTPFDSGYVDMAARFMDVLSHATRLHLILLLAQGEANVSQLSEALDLPQSNVSHHLGILRNLGLVTDRREGQYVHYGINEAAWRVMGDGFFDRLLEGQDEVQLQNFLITRRPGES